MGLQVSRVPNRVKPCVQRWLCWNCFLLEECCWCRWARWKSWACQILPRHKLVEYWIKRKETTSWKWWVWLTMTLSSPHFWNKTKVTGVLLACNKSQRSSLDQTDVGFWIMYISPTLWKLTASQLAVHEILFTMLLFCTHICGTWQVCCEKHCRLVKHCLLKFQIVMVHFRVQVVQFHVSKWLGPALVANKITVNRDRLQ